MPGENHSLSWIRFHGTRMMGLLAAGDAYCPVDSSDCVATIRAGF